MSDMKNRIFSLMRFFGWMCLPGLVAGLLVILMLPAPSLSRVQLDKIRFQKTDHNIAVAYDKGIERLYGAEAADLIRRVQESNIQWLAVHAKSRMYRVSYRWKVMGATVSGLEESEIVGRYDRPFLNTPISEFVIYGGFLGEPRDFSCLPSWISDSSADQTDYTIRGVITGQEAAFLVPYIVSPVRVGPGLENDYRNLWLFPQVKAATIEYEIRVDGSSFLVKEERFSVWSPEFGLQDEVAFDTFQINYAYQFDEDSAYPSKISSQVVEFASIPRTHIAPVRDLANAERSFGQGLKRWSNMTAEATFVQGLWLPYLVTQESVLENGQKSTYRLEASDFRVERIIPPGVPGPTWIRGFEPRLRPPDGK